MSEFNSYLSNSSYLDIKKSVTIHCPGASDEYQIDDRHSQSFIPAYHAKISELEIKNDELRRNSDNNENKYYQSELERLNQKINEQKEIISDLLDYKKLVSQTRLEDYLYNALMSGEITKDDIKKVILTYNKANNIQDELIPCNKHKK